MAILAEYDWKQGHIDPWWTTHRALNYVNEPFNDPNSVNFWRSLGFTQERFTGDMFDMRNSTPEWIEPFREYFPWKEFSWSVYRMNPGVVLPNHKDLFVKFRQIHNIRNPQTICRAVVFLEDWASGHYFEIDSVPLVKWRAGDYVAWRYDAPHTAANIGFTDRYTLQITGILDEDKQL